MKISVLIIENEYGVSSYVGTTQDDVVQHLLEYVREWWNHEIDDSAMPSDPNAAIEEYFSRVDDESYVIDNNIELSLPKPNRWLIVDNNNNQIGKLFKSRRACCAAASKSGGRVVDVVV